MVGYAAGHANIVAAMRNGWRRVRALCTEEKEEECENQRCSHISHAETLNRSGDDTVLKRLR